jgi:hypothetical protein
MDAAVLFEEVQASGGGGTQKFLRGLAAVFALALVGNLLWQGGEVSGLTAFIFIAGAVCLVGSIMLAFRLITQVRTDGIYVRYAPLQPAFVRYAWTDVRQVYLRRYNALPEYGGWGLRMGPYGGGYIVPSEWGIQLVLQDGKKILVSTNRPEEVTEVLRNLGLL